MTAKDERVRELVQRVNALAADVGRLQTLLALTVGDLHGAALEVQELREAIRKCVEGFEEFHNREGTQWELMVDPIVDAAELIDLKPNLED